MSFGFSPTDVVNLVQFSARIYVAFKDANDNSETQVSGLVREFSTFHHCLEELSELMKEYGKPLPFPYLEFQETLKRCEESIEPYANKLVDRRMSVKKIIYTIKYIGKEKEIENLRTQITGHYQALQMCISFLQLLGYKLAHTPTEWWVEQPARISSTDDIPGQSQGADLYPRLVIDEFTLTLYSRLHLEATKQTQRLLDLAPMRTMSIGGQYYTTNALGSSLSTTPNALPPPSEADQLYKDWLIFSRWLKSEDERLALQAGNLVRPLSLGGTPVVSPDGDEQRAAVLYHLRRELEDAILIEENRAKRIAVEKRSNLSPSDAMREEIRNLPPIPLRTYTLDTEHSGAFSRFDNATLSMSDSATTIRAAPATTSPAVSPTGSPQIPHSYFEPVDWSHVSPHASPSSSSGHDRTPSLSTDRSSMSTSPESRPSVGGLGISTAGTTPEDQMHPLRSRISAASLVSIALGPGALQWNKLCRKVHVERATSHGVESRECDLHWRYREDAGISIRSMYRSGSSKEVKVWITQHFPATGPSIPSTTSLDEEVFIDFPRASFGRLEKRFTGIKYTCMGADSSLKLQTLLYTNNGKEEAELLFDRRIQTISSNLNKPECREKNLRLWRRRETHVGSNGAQKVDVLVVLFYTSALPDEKAHWVEESHYVFQWLDESTYKKNTDKLQLIFSKEPETWMRDKLFQRRKSSKSSVHGEHSVESQEIGTGLRRSGTVNSVVSSSAVSVQSGKSIFGGGRPNAAGSMNRFGYSELEIKFHSKTDRKDFVEVWRKHVKTLR